MKPFLNELVCNRYWSTIGSSKRVKNLKTSIATSISELEAHPQDPRAEALLARLRTLN